MKKYLLAALVFVLCFASVTAVAAGKLNVAQENFHKIDMYSPYGYLYAKVENVGDKPIKVNAGLLEIYDENGDPLTSTDYINAYVTYLQPGAYTYVRAYDEVEQGLDAVDDYMFTVSGKSDKDTEVIVFPCEAYYEVDTSNPYWTKNNMYATLPILRISRCTISRLWPRFWMQRAISFTSRAIPCITMRSTPEAR